MNMLDTTIDNLFKTTSLHRTDGAKLEWQYRSKAKLLKSYKKLKNARPFRDCRNLKYSTTFLYLNSDEKIKSPKMLP